MFDLLHDLDSDIAIDLQFPMPFSRLRAFSSNLILNKTRSYFQWNRFLYRFMDNSKEFLYDIQREKKRERERERESFTQEFPLPTFAPIWSNKLFESLMEDPILLDGGHGSSQWFSCFENHLKDFQTLIHLKMRKAVGRFQILTLKNNCCTKHPSKLGCFF